MSRNVHPAPTQTPPLSCVRTARRAARPAWTPVITASAVLKAAINSFSTRGGAGQIAQSKLDKLSSQMKRPFVWMLFVRLTSLPTHFRGFFETAEESCEACDSSCLSCDGIKSQCLSCADGHYLESGVCGLNCSLQTYPADDGTCRRCSPHCDVCSDETTCFSESSAEWAAF